MYLFSFIKDLSSSHSSSHSSLNQSGHSVHSHQSLNQSFNSSFTSQQNHHQGHNQASHNLARNHTVSPSTSSSNLYHAHFASSTNQNHSSGAVTPHQNATVHQQGSERRQNTSPSYANSVVQQSGHGSHSGVVKGADRSSGGSGNYRQYAGGHAGAHANNDLHNVKSQHLTAEQHHRLFNQSKQGTGISTSWHYSYSDTLSDYISSLELPASDANQTFALFLTCDKHSFPALKTVMK